VFEADFITSLLPSRTAKVLWKSVDILRRPWHEFIVAGIWLTEVNDAVLSPPCIYPHKAPSTLATMSKERSTLSKQLWLCCQKLQQCRTIVYRKIPSFRQSRILQYSNEFFVKFRPSICVDFVEETKFRSSLLPKTATMSKQLCRKNRSTCSIRQCCFDVAAAGGDAASDGEDFRVIKTCTRPSIIVQLTVNDLLCMERLHSRVPFSSCLLSLYPPHQKPWMCNVT